MTQEQQLHSSEERIAALESQVRRLESLLGGGDVAQDGAAAAYDRRSLLRRGGAVIAAGAAGAMALPALTGSAAAADGGNFLLGQTNVESSTSTLNRDVNDGGPTLITGNSAATPTTGRSGLGSPPLRVSPTTLAPDPTTSKSGDFFVQTGTGGVPTQLLFTHESPTTSQDAAIGSVYTDYLANLFVPVKQNSAARAFHTTIPRGGVAQINFNPFLSANGYLVAAIGVLQVNKVQGGNGYLTLYPAGTSRPSISAITWLYPNDRLSTLSIAIPGVNNMTNVYAAMGAEVFFDVVGLLVPSPASVADAHLAPGAVSNSARTAKIRAQHTARF